MKMRHNHKRNIKAGVTSKNNVNSAKKRRIVAANSGNASASKIKKFIEDAVVDLQNGSSTNNRLVLDNDLCLYVGYSDGFDTEDGYAICAKIAERNDADWADFDYLNMPWNTYSDNDGTTGVFEGDVYDTNLEIVPGEDYSQDAQWLADSYAEIRKLLDNGELTIEASCGKKSVKSSMSRRTPARAITAAEGVGDKIIVKSLAYVDVTEDDYEQGAVGPYVNSWDFDVRGEYNSADELIKAIANNSYVFSDKLEDYYFMDGSLRTSAEVDVDNEIPSEGQYEAWKRGEEQLYIADMYLAIEVGSVHEMTDDEAQAYGFQLY